MRENEKKLNVQDDENNIDAPIFWLTAFLVLLIGIMIWFGIKRPVIFGNIRDFLITMAAAVSFLISIVLAFLFFFLASRIKGARKQVDEALATADGKVEELALEIEKILRKILEPLIGMQSKKAGILHIFQRKKTEE